MFDRYTSDLAKASLLLHTVKGDRDRLDLVLELQRFLIRQISRLERRLKRVGRAEENMRKRRSNDRPSRETANKLKLSIEKCSSVKERLRQQMFIWRCFGDGIAGAYQSKYSLKYLYFDRNSDIKESAGFLTGKSGFRLEWRLVKLGIQMNVPVVLSDITNVIRHGDVCALAGADPLPIEAKSGKRLNARGIRQKADREELHNYFENDGAPLFRGMINLRRFEMHAPEINHNAAANACIDQSLSQVSATVEPEPGLRYVAIRSRDAEVVVQSVLPYAGKFHAVYHLTPTLDWTPSYPFTLSLKPANLIDFVLGRVSFLVIIDIRQIKTHFKALGLHTTAQMDGNWAIQFCKDPDELAAGVFRITERGLAKVATEFKSLEWFVREMAEALLRKPEDLTHLSKEELEALPGAGWETPQGWLQARDLFDDSTSIDQGQA
ncbi:hypothetical protein [Polaromonas sp.]|uniref:hypothetical protein n=1 Tax=Polaromonas sp. TaxID=1869339 RepID=UPI0032658144